MKTWKEKRNAGMCGQCGNVPPAPGKSRCEKCLQTVRRGYQKWAEEHRDKDQARKNEWFKTKKGRAAAKRNNDKRNPLRDRRKLNQENIAVNHAAENWKGNVNGKE